jgi:outer membrane immunogenic protein
MGKSQMKKFLLSTVGLFALGIAAPAAAADLPVRAYTKAPMVAPAYDWSGFYIGINGGGGWAQNDHSDLTPGGGFFTTGPGGAFGGTQRVNANGALFGGQAGYNWQMSNWVFGLEVAGDGTNMRRTSTALPPIGRWVSSTLTWISGAVTGLVQQWGQAQGPNSLTTIFVSPPSRVA